MHIFILHSCGELGRELGMAMCLYLPIRIDAVDLIMHGLLCETIESWLMYVTCNYTLTANQIILINADQLSSPGIGKHIFVFNLTFDNFQRTSLTLFCQQQLYLLRGS